MSIVGSAGSGLGGVGDIGGALGSFYGHKIDQSLRFNRPDNPRLTRTPGSASNLQTWTWSAWIKRSNISIGTNNSSYAVFFSCAGTLFGFFNPTGNKGADGFGAFLSDGEDDRWFTNRIFRDPNAWYNLVVVLDTTNSTAADRFRLYVNGVRNTSWSRSDTITQNTNKGINTAAAHFVGCDPSSVNSFDGYMAEINFIDGTALNGDSFGETKDNIWVPKDASGLTFGTNGFYLPFSVTQGNSAFFDGSGDSLKFSNASHYDIASDDDFTLEFFFNHLDVDGYGDFIGNYATNGPHFLVGFDNRTEKDFYFYTGNGASFLWQMSSNSGIVANKWHHVAFQRNGTVFRCYVDGVRQTNLSDPSSNTGYTISGGNSTDFDKAYDLAHMEMGSPTGADFEGFLSNVRLVIGASVYANDDNNITVPTATLTKVSGTALLALTTSTITKDSSDNNVTGSVAGDAVYRQNSPFSTIIGKDASGESNDFAAAGALAFTDVGPDSPTNNFCTLNFLDNISTTYSEGCLGIAQSSYDINSRGTMAVSSGKWYWEIHMGSTHGEFGVCENGKAGQADPQANIGFNFIYNNGSAGVSYKNASAGSQSTGSISMTHWAAGDICQIAYDGDNGILYHGLNGTYQTSGNPAGGSGGLITGIAPQFGGTMVPFFGVGTDNARTFVVNFGQDSSFSGSETNGSADASDGNGQGNFFYAPPSGFLALCSANLPEPDIIDGSEHFNTVLYTGNATARNITGVGFSPDWTWIKRRNGTGRHILTDSVRGGTIFNFTNETTTEYNDSSIGHGIVNGFVSDGFTLGDNGTTSFAKVNTNNDTFVAWNWLAGTAFSNDQSATSVGTIDSVGQVNTEAGFSIITYTSPNSSDDQTVAHGLSKAPELILAKMRTGTYNWDIHHKDIHPNSLIFTNAVKRDADAFTTTAPTTAVFGLKDNYTHDAQLTYVAYSFHSVEGYSKVGAYSGNANANGTFVFTGFRPAWLIVKAYNNARNWTVYDNTRTPFNLIDGHFHPNATTAEQTGEDEVDFLSNGFKFRTNEADSNYSGFLYIYYAIAEQPFKFSNAR